GMVAASFTVSALTPMCSASGRTTWRSMVHVVAGGGELVRAPLATGRTAPGPVYVPTISKLWAVARPSEAPFSRARVVGCARSKGRSQDESAVSTAAAATSARAPFRAVENERENAKAFGSVTGCIL